VTGYLSPLLCTYPRTLNRELYANNAKHLIFRTIASYTERENIPRGSEMHVLQTFYGN